MKKIYKALAVLAMATVLFLWPNGIIMGASRDLPIFSVDTAEKVVALTFNAAWADADTEKILDILAENKIKASFFLCGIWVRNNPGLLERIYAEGHDVCSHGDSHAHVASLSEDGNQKEIMGVHEKVKALTGFDMNLYRPAYGEYNSTVLSAARGLGYNTIQWNVDSRDWEGGEPGVLTRRVLEHKNLRNGSIILFHTDGKHTAAALGAIIEGLRDKGYGFVPVSKLIYRNGFEIDHEGRQRLTKPSVE